MLDRHLNWNCYITELCKKISSQIGIIRRLKCLPMKVSRMLYFSLIHSRLSYCVGIWGSANKTMIDNIERLQRISLKVTHKLSIRFPSKLLFSKYCPKILRVKGMYHYSVCKFVYSCTHNLCHHNLDFRVPTNRYPTSCSTLLTVPLTLTGRGISFSGPFSFNKLPKVLREIQSLNQFCRLLKINLSLNS